MRHKEYLNCELEKNIFLKEKGTMIVKRAMRKIDTYILAYKLNLLKEKNRVRTVMQPVPPSCKEVVHLLGAEPSELSYSDINKILDVYSYIRRRQILQMLINMCVAAIIGIWFIVT